MYQGPGTLASKRRALVAIGAERVRGFFVMWLRLEKDDQGFEQKLFGPNAWKSVDR
jgi:hypothetical protein